MNLEKFIRIGILFIILISPIGCSHTRLLKDPVNNFNPDKEVIQAMWSEGIRITKINPSPPPPNIFFESREEKLPPPIPEDCSKYEEKEKIEQCEKDNAESAKPSEICARAYLDDSYKIRIYCDTILDDLYEKNGKDWPKETVQLTVIFFTVTHEMLHQLYWKMGVPVYDQHKKMKESGDLEKLMDYISYKYGIRWNSKWKELSMKKLDSGIK